MRGTWRTDPRLPLWQRVLGIILLAVMILVVFYRTEVMDQVKQIKIVVASPSPSPSPSATPQR